MAKRALRTPRAKPEDQMKALIDIINQDPGPLMVTVGVNRINGRIAISVSGNLKDPIGDLGILTEALDTARRALEKERLGHATKAATVEPQLAAEKSE